MVLRYIRFVIALVATIGVTTSCRSNAKVYKEGTIKLAATEVIDLDNAISSSDGGDIWLNAVRPGVFEIRVFKGASISKVGTQSPGFAGCNRSNLSGETAINLSDLRQGDYLCVKTNEGRLAEIQVAKVESATDTASPAYKMATLKYVVWQ